MKTNKILFFTVLFAATLHAMEQPPSQSDYLGKELISAIVNCKDTEVQRLLDMNADMSAVVNYVNVYNVTPLMCAAHEGKKHICELLIKKGADIFYTNAAGNSALERAASWSCQPVSEFFVEKMLSIPTEAQKARVHAFAQCLKRMCPHQFHNTCDVFKAHLRTLIVKENTHRVCREVCALEDSPTKNHLIEKYFAKEELLLHAADAGDDKCVQRLIAEGVGVDDYVDSGKRTALFCAASMGWQDICGALADVGADIYSKDKKGVSVLQYAANHPAFIFVAKSAPQQLVEKMIDKDGEARARAEVEGLSAGNAKEFLLQKYFPNPGLSAIALAKEEVSK